MSDSAVFACLTHSPTKYLVVGLICVLVLSIQSCVSVMVQAIAQLESTHIISCMVTWNISVCTAALLRI